MPPQTQTAVIQSPTSSIDSLPLAIAHSRPIPPLPTPYHVLVRVHAVGLNPTDHKMITHFPMPHNTVGCDFCGVVETAGAEAVHPPGTRVCGADFPYRKDNPYNGAFAQYAVADSRHLLRVPDAMDHLHGAAMGSIGWGTAALAIGDKNALALDGLPSRPVEKPLPVLVYGAATATGIMDIYLLQNPHPPRAGYMPIAVCSPRSAPFIQSLGAVGTANYLSPTCVEEVKALADGQPIKHALDCITDAESVAVCFAALARTGARLACLEAVPERWITRRAVKLKIVMGFEGQGFDVDLGHEVYSRKKNMELHGVAQVWAGELQAVVDNGGLRTMAIREVPGGFEAVVEGLEMLKRGDVKGQKLVVAIPQEV